MQVKLRASGYMVPCDITWLKDKIEIQFSYNKDLLAEIKLLKGARWNPEEKKWTATNCTRNLFQLMYLQGDNPYARWEYDATIAEMRSTLVIKPAWKPYDHQIRMAAVAAKTRRTIIAGDMGTGKTLAAFIATETVLSTLEPDAEVWYIGPKAGCRAVALEVSKWGISFKMRFITYEQLVKVMEAFTGTVPRVVLFDESSKVKTDTSKRSVAAKALERKVTATYGWDSLVVLMTGTPAPKSPLDWYNQCEIAQEGFLREGDKYKFQNRLSVQEKMEGMGGVAFSTLVTWLDDENKCATCGQPESHLNHSYVSTTSAETIAAGLANLGYKTNATRQVSAVKDTRNVTEHRFVKSQNEVARLYKRMAGLVVFIKKEDCLNLPKKVYIERNIKPTIEMLQLAKAVKQLHTSAIEVLSYMRELSDGFLYEDVTTDKHVTCGMCAGTGISNQYTPVNATTGESIEDTNMVDSNSVRWNTTTGACSGCGGTKTVNQVERQVKVIGSPKDGQLVDDLELLEDIGRAIIWAGFKASVDRCVDIAAKEGWTILRIDGRGFHAIGTSADVTELLIAMDYSHPRCKELAIKYPKLCVVGNPKAGGMALTLTAASTAIYYSNSFDGEARMQSEDRHHRAGMAENRPAVVIDYYCLNSDKLVKDNLANKKRLQDLTTVDLKKLLAHSLVE